jgi:hypothetical protein
MTRYLLLFDSYGLVFLRRPFWREDGSVLCICCWPLPAQFFSGPSSLVLATIFYCLRFETSLFIASYDSQGDGGGTRPRLHTGFYIPSAGLGSSLYSFGADPIENIVSIIAQKYIDFCLYICYRGNLFTEFLRRRLPDCSCSLYEVINSAIRVHVPLISSSWFHPFNCLDIRRSSLFRNFLNILYLPLS